MVWTCFGTVSAGYRSIRLRSGTGDVECSSLNGIACDSFPSIGQCVAQPVPLAAVACPMYLRAGTNLNCSASNAVGSSDPSVYQCQSSDRATPSVATSKVEGADAFECVTRTPTVCSYVTTAQSCLGLFVYPSIKPPPVALACKLVDVSQPLPDFCATTSSSLSLPTTVRPASTTSNEGTTVTMIPPQVEQAQPTSSTSSSSSMTTTTTLVLAIAIPLCLVAVAVYCFLRRSRRLKQTMPNDQAPYIQHKQPNDMDGADSAAASNTSTDMDLSALVGCRIPCDDVRKGKLLGTGGFGQVYRGTCLGQVVAIKQLVPRRQHVVSDVQNFIREMTLLARYDE
ncbi:hypothetical protein DYB30_012627 [Aphanomyces astaci]|uniref:Protein kinase domain-containing protein n=1 Tax=Aphanomyces astaci TaxID=112090 RepID=A0A397DJQ8_APHAT|nr:hypothetical protein DYB30_012627 [Aphanomyces astaci]